MPEDSDYNPGAWKGHDFTSARAHYAASAPAVVATAAAANVTVTSLVPDRISTESMSPVVILQDVTGSFGDWPATIFSKLPYLDLEGKEYLGADMEVAFLAIGDARAGDQWSLQVQPFGSGPVLKDNIARLLVEKGGGGGGCETYELGALYLCHNVDMPYAVRPICIFVADEQPYDLIEPTLAKQIAKVNIQSAVTREDLFTALKQKYAVYVIYKHFSPTSRRAWVSLVGEDHVADLDDPNRVVDVIFGIFAKETGRVAYFKNELEQRQEVGTPAGKKKVDTVYTALRSIHANAPDAADGKSTMHKLTDGKPTRSLL